MTLLEHSLFSLAGTQSLEMPCRWKDLTTLRRWRWGEGKRKGRFLLRISRHQLQWESGKKSLLCTWTLQAVSRVKRTKKLLILQGRNRRRGGTKPKVWC